MIAAFASRYTNPSPFHEEISQEAGLAD